jgi:hypothetical protein
MMRTIAVAGILTLAASGAPGQVIFSEHFASPILGPHWTTVPAAPNATYTVQNGRLTLSSMIGPTGGHGQTATNATFIAQFPMHYGDFVARIRIGWAQGQSRVIRVYLTSRSPNYAVAQMDYADSTAWINGSLGGLPAVGRPMPAGATHEFEIARRGGEFHYLVNGRPVGTLVDNDLAIGQIAIDVMLFAWGAFQPVYVESIVIVPFSCYANCDGSTADPLLTAEDIACFVEKYADAQRRSWTQRVHYVNCDGSTEQPYITVFDFLCFMNQFAAGCP